MSNILTTLAAISQSITACNYAYQLENVERTLFERLDKHPYAEYQPYIKAISEDMQWRRVVIQMKNSYETDEIR